MESAEKTLYHILKEAGGKVKIRADLVKALKNKRFEPNVVTNVLGERLDRKLAPAGGERFIRLNKSKKAIKIQLESAEETRIETIPPLKPPQNKTWVRELKELREEPKSDMKQIKESLREITESLIQVEAAITNPKS